MRLSITVIPRSSRNSIQRQLDGGYKVRLTSAPVDGEANKQLIELLAKEFGVRKSEVKIIMGQASKKKVVEVKM